MNWDATRGLTPAGPSMARAVHPTKNVLHRRTLSANDDHVARRFAGLSYRFEKPFFLKSICASISGQDEQGAASAAPVVAVQKMIDRALLVGCPMAFSYAALRSWMFTSLGAGGFGKTIEQEPFPRQRHVPDPPAARLGFQPFARRGHKPYRSVHRAQGPPIASAMSGCVIPFSRSNTIWIRCRIE